MHGGKDVSELINEDVDALLSGCANLMRHVENCRRYGLPVVVAINHFVNDTQKEIECIGKLVK